jgi:hypothetical protein
VATPRQAAVTVASGRHAEILDRTFTSFAQNPFLELHAFIIGDALPAKRLPGITYHLAPPDPGYCHPMRDLYYRRMLLLDQLEADYAVVVDNHDVLCLRPIPELPELLRGAALGACVEHVGGRYLAGQGYTSAYLNAGVTFWHIPSSRRLREEYAARGRARFRSVEDQLTLNEVVHSRYYDDLIILPVPGAGAVPPLADGDAPGWRAHLSQRLLPRGGAQAPARRGARHAARPAARPRAAAALAAIPPQGPVAVPTAPRPLSDIRSRVWQRPACAAVTLPRRAHSKTVWSNPSR